MAIFSCNKCGETDFDFIDQCNKCGDCYPDHCECQDLSNHCRSCGALPGEECQSQSRHHTSIHAARRKANESVR